MTISAAAKSLGGAAFALLALLAGTPVRATSG
jgi:hypothetical protein